MPSAISLGFEVNDGNFKTALKAIDSEIKAMNEGVTAATKEIEALGDSQDRSAQRSELLTKMLDAQNQKLSALQTEYDKNVQKLDALAQALEEAKKSNDPEAIAKATNAYNKQRTEVANLESAMNKTKAGIADTTAKLSESGEAAQDMGEKVGQLAEKIDVDLAKNGLENAKQGLMNFANAAKEVALAIWDTASESSVFADDMLTLATQTGLTTTQLQEYGYASRFIDTEVSVITGSLTKLTKNMGSSSKEVGAAFDTLGVKTTDASGHMKDSETVFFELIDALGNVKNETERDQLAMALFGRSAQQLNPLIEAGSAAWQQYAQEAHDAGLIISEEGMGALGSFNDELQRVDATMEASKNQIMAALAPAFTTIGQVVANVAQEFTKWVQTDQAQAMLQSMADTVVRLVQEMSGNLGPIIETVKQGFSMLAEGIRFVIENSEFLTTAFKVLAGAIIALQIAQFAASIAALANPIGIVVAAVTAMATAVTLNFDKIKSSTTAAWDGIRKKWDAAKAFFKSIWDSISNTFASVGEFFRDKFDSAYKAVTGVWNAAGQFFSGVWQTITKVFDIQTMVNIGKNLMQGLWNGIQSMGEWVKQAITSFVEERIAKPIKDFFGIKSPSKWAERVVGANIDRGIANGVANNAGVIASAIRMNMPSAADVMGGSDAYTVGSNVASRSGGQIGRQVLLDNRPIILKINDREFGRAVREAAYA